MTMFYSVVVLILLIIPSYSQIRGTERHHQVETNNSECFACHIVRPEVLRQEGNEDKGKTPDFLKCLTKLPGASYRESFTIELPESFIVENKRIIQSGKAHICIPGGYVHDRTVLIPPGTNVVLVGDHRKLFQDDPELRFGTKSLLAIRVKSLSEEPDEELEGIESAIFGRPNNPEIIPEEATVVAQYNAVSHGQLRFEPAVGPNIQNGVLEIELDLSFEGKDVEEIMIPEILAKTEEAIGSLEIADRFIFCLPTGSLLHESSTWTAFGYLYEPYMYFQQSRCTRLSVVIHELGHTFGFQHSGAGGDDYADNTDYMGYAVNMVGFPRKAFNGHKHWFSGWFGNRQVDVDPFLQDYTFVRLVAFVDYGKSDLMPTDAVLIRVDNLYIQYNRAKDYNAETDQADTITVTKFISDDEATSAVAALNGGERYLYSNYQGSGLDLVIEVCELTVTEPMIDYAAVKVYFDNNVGHPSCEKLSGFIDNPSFLTPSPSRNMPTPSTVNPTRSPTVSTSLEPTLEPSLVQSWRSRSPTINPTRSPTVSTSSEQTLEPSLEPSWRIRSPASNPPRSISLTMTPTSSPYTTVSIRTGVPSMFSSLIPQSAASLDPISPYQTGAPSSTLMTVTLSPVSPSQKPGRSSSGLKLNNAMIIMIVSVGIFTMALALVIILVRWKRFSSKWREHCQVKEKMHRDTNTSKNKLPTFPEHRSVVTKSSVPVSSCNEMSETEYADDLSGRSDDEIFICETRLTI